MFVGIDQSYTSCAYVITNVDVQIVSFGIFKTDKSQDVFERSLVIAQQISQLVELNQITRFNIEGLAFAMRGDSTRDLAGLLFTIMALMNIHHPSVVKSIIPPTSLKKFATGTGKADKNEMIAALPVDVKDAFVAKGFKKTTGLTDLADAYWLSVHGR